MVTMGETRTRSWQTASAPETPPKSALDIDDVTNTRASPLLHAVGGAESGIDASTRTLPPSGLPLSAMPL
jgi:hypothetical protein